MPDILSIWNMDKINQRYNLRKPEESGGGAVIISHDMLSVWSGHLRLCYDIMQTNSLFKSAQECQQMFYSCRTIIMIIIMDDTGSSLQKPHNCVYIICTYI